jgi:hypothetical protein
MLDKGSRDTFVQNLTIFGQRSFWAILKIKKYLKQKHFISEINL